jgi:hypothetical protein
MIKRPPRYRDPDYKEPRIVEMLPVVTPAGEVEHVKAAPELVTPPAPRRVPTGGLFDAVAATQYVFNRNAFAFVYDPIEALADVDAAVDALNATFDRWNK